jgi:hypothetical protein
MHCLPNAYAARLGLSKKNMKLLPAKIILTFSGFAVLVLSSLCAITGKVFVSLASRILRSNTVFEQHNDTLQTYALHMQCLCIWGYIYEITARKTRKSSFHKSSPLRYSACQLIQSDDGIRTELFTQHGIKIISAFFQLKNWRK